MKILSGLTWLMSHVLPATKIDMKKALNKIMSALSDYVGRVNTAFDKIDNAVSGVAEDVAFLKKTIEEMQNNPGPISPEDQVLLDALEARVTTVAGKLEALDAQTTPPPPPPAP